MIVLNVLVLMGLPVIFYSAFERTEISTRIKLNKVEAAGGINPERLAPLLADTRERTGYRKTCKRRI